MVLFVSNNFFFFILPYYSCFLKKKNCDNGERKAIKLTIWIIKISILQSLLTTLPFVRYYPNLV